MKKLILFMSCVVLVFGMAACGSKKDNEEPKTELEDNEPEAEEEIPEEEGLPEGMVLSIITGEPIPEAAAERKPFAVTINNLHAALPQSGIGQASLYYETLAEGEITRIVAIFEDFDAEKIGPVRSAREYFTYFALDNGAVYVHHGGSETGYAAVRNRGLDNLDGMVDKAFWRDKVRQNTPGMYEHSSYTDYESLMEGVEAKGFNMTRDVAPMFHFYDEETALAGDVMEAKIVELPYSYYQISKFTFDDETRLYTRSQSGKDQIDDLTGEAITVKNIIIQQTTVYVIPGDDAGRRSVELVGSGSGVFITNGKARTITWEKVDYKTPTKWYDEKGNELMMNKGKTWICVYPDNLNYTLSGGAEEAGESNE